MKRFFAALMSLIAALGLASYAAPPAQAAAGDKLIALTFDDGPGPYTNRLLDGLKERDVKVTFFIVGSRVRSWPDAVERAFREGHQIAGHSYDHTQLTTLSADGVKSQIQRTNEYLAAACGADIAYMLRPPYGSHNSTVRSVVDAPLVLWSVDPEDWKDRNADTVKERVVNGAFDGAIILLHDIHSTSVDGALAAIDELLEQGYEFVTVRELFRRRGVEMKAGTAYSSCKPNDTDLGPVAVPVLSSRPVGGRQEITLTAQSGTTIWYSLEGPEFGVDSEPYTGSFTVDSPCTVWAMAAYDMNGSRSAVLQQAFSLPTALSPKIRVEDGVLTLETRSPGAALAYTLEGASATDAPVVYTEPAAIEPGTTISAWASGPDYLTSETIRALWSHRGNLFRDVSAGDWFYRAVDQVVEAGIMNGTGGGYFSPDEPMTRSQLVTMLYRVSGETLDWELGAACPFTDLVPGSFYEEAVRWAWSVGIVQGSAKDRFDPNAPISRQEMSKLLAGFLAWRGIELPDIVGAANRYADAADIAPWALEAVEMVTACGLMKGDGGGFDPEGGASRAQGATVLVRLLDMEPDADQAAGEQLGME